MFHPRPSFSGTMLMEHLLDGLLPNSAELNIEKNLFLHLIRFRI